MLNLRRYLYLRRSLRYNSLPLSNFSNVAGDHHSSVDKKEVETFSKVNDWWDKFGSMRPLHAYNEARVKYIQNIVQRFSNKSANKFKRLEGINILDVGCGGGLLCESLARLGGNITGIDATPEVIQIAEEHAKRDPSLQKNLKYINMPLESLVKLGHKYDIVTNVEVIEHVNDPSSFAKSLGEACNKDGLCFISTINKTWQAYAVTILGAEYLTRIVPVGTHHFEKFISPDILRDHLTAAGFEVVDMQGFAYDVFNNKMSESSDLSVNYFIAARKME